MKIAVLLLTAIALAAPAAAAPPDAPAELVEDGYFEVAEKVAGRVWVIRQAEPFHLQPIGNVTVIEQADGLVLVDSGGSAGGGRRIVGLVKGLSSKPVKAVILTHWHGDHPQGLSEILRTWPEARTIATAETRRHLATPATMNTPPAPDAERNAALLKQFESVPKMARDNAAKATTEAERQGWAKLERLFLWLVRDMDGTLTATPKEGFEDQIALDDPEAPVEARFLGRANTDGDAVVWLPKQRVLVTGDIVVSPVPYGFGSYPREWIEVLGKLKTYDFAVLVPGHGAPMRDAAYIERVAALLAEVRRQVEPLAAQGATLQEAQAKVDLSAQSRTFTGGDPWREHWFNRYWTQPIVASALKEAKGEPIVQGLGG